MCLGTNELLMSGAMIAYSNFLVSVRDDRARNVFRRQALFEQEIR